MTTAQPTVSDAIPQWERDLDQVGFVRRLLAARRWHGADWWFAALSSLLLLFILSVALFPGFYAPYHPRAEVGPGLLAPRQLPPAVLLVGQAGGVSVLEDLAGEDATLGQVRGSEAVAVLRDVADSREQEASAAGNDISLRPRQVRFNSMEEALAALDAGEVNAVVGLAAEIDPLISGYSNVAVGESLTGTIQKSFALGTNQIGQDLLSRIIWGTRVALIVGFSASISASVLGVPLGLAAGFWSGRLERVLTLFMDSLYSFPGLILAIAITSVLGPGLLNVIGAIAVVYVPTYYRIVRGQTLAIKEELYVDAARSLGATSRSILTRYILPNVIPSLVVIFSINVADAILTEAGLAFLGLGLPPDIPDWGVDVAQGQDYLRQAWWLVTFPGVMIMITTLGFSVLGESLSEILNPRLSES